MSKADTIDALMDSAIQSFSRFGYEGASLRDIARDADVPLSTIHLYFGSKAELFSAVSHKAWNEIDHERGVLLQQALSKHGERPPLLGDLIYALAFPVVRRALSKNERELAQIYIVRSHTAHLQYFRDGGNSPLIDVADRSVVRWIDAMMLSCPTLSRQDVIWAFSFVVGSIYSWQLIDHRYDRLLGPDIERKPEDVAGDIVAFCASGIEAIVARRNAERGLSR
ncbi:MAG TPA: TetR family transcriptional regulator [Vitreimonas sp.]|jgi:AcrR family transcriptional regulator|nr:TetR family transcriptional regulator [Vitreimonas sp.]